MKADFADKQKKAAKKKKSKAAKKLKAKAEGAIPKEGDVSMADAAEVPQAVPTKEAEEPATTAGDMEDGDDEQPQPGARDKHRTAVQLRKSLKVKVQVLKKARQKVTKVANAKGARRQLTDKIKGLVKERKSAPRT